MTARDQAGRPFRAWPSYSHSLAAPGQRVIEDLRLAGVDASPDVLEAVVDLAIEIAREGREGRKVGTLFTVGDDEAVLAHSRPLILDPLALHPAAARRIDDPELRETIKELAQLDGGFVISGDGVAQSACRFFESSLAHVDVHLGLGTRHIAAASISVATRAVAVVVSESSVVRVFQRGALQTEILPELWLLRRFIPHLSQPHLTEHRDDNIVVVSPTTSEDREPDSPAAGES